jgi:hypothetical protein
MRNAAQWRRPKADMIEPTKTVLDGRTIASPDNGCFLPKIVDSDEFAVRQGFTGNHGLASRRLF